VIGLGYVGLPIAVAFENKVPVIGFNIDKPKKSAYENVADPTCEVGNEQLSQATVQFTSNPSD